MSEICDKPNSIYFTDVVFCECRRINSMALMVNTAIHLFLGTMVRHSQSTFTTISLIDTI